MTLVPRLARAGVPRVDSFLQERPLRHTPRAAVALSPRAVRAAGLVAPALTGGLLALHVVDAPWVALVPAVVAAVIAVPLAFAKLGNKRALPVDALGPLGILAAAVAIGVALAGPSSPFVLLLLAVSTALGALVPGRRLALALPACAAALTGAFAFANADASTMVADAVVLLGFGMLGRALFFGTLFAVRIREEARVDGELLKLYDDARLFGLMGTAEEGDDSAADKRLAAQTLAARDGSYRVLRLGARALKPDAAALYLLDNSGKELVLKEQLLDVDGPLVPRFSASAGAPGLALKRGQAVRLVDADGPAVQVHRRGAKSVLCAPLRDGAVLRGVVVFDRSHADLFSDDDESLALALCEELIALLRTERVLERLDSEHKKIGRIFMAARAFGGVVRVDEAMEHTLTAALDLAPHASAAV
ncbi:MAG TPA: GAF domain-containing protein, partial [Myxococcota bacterium]